MVKKEYIDNSKTYLLLLLFAFIYVFFNSECSPLYLYNEWSDPHIYFSMGKGAFNGKIIYKEIFDHKGPLIFFIYGIGYLISNDTLLGIYIIESIFLSVNLYFAYKIASLYIPKKLAIVCSLLFAVVLFLKTAYGGSADEYLSVFIIISFYYFILFFKDDSISQRETYKHLFIHGCMFMLVFLTKFSACVFWLPLILVMCYKPILKRDFKQIIRYALVFLIGIIIVSIPFIIYFANNSAIYDFYWGYIEFNILYAGSDTGSGIIAFLKIYLSRICDQMIMKDPIFVILLSFGLYILVFTKKYISNIVYRIALLLSFILCFFTVTATYFLMEYAQIILCIYAIFGIIAFLDFIKKYINSNSKWIVPVFLITALAIGVYNKKLFYQDIDCLLRKKECYSLQDEYAQIIRKEKDKSLIYYLQLDGGVMTKANIIPSYKYFFCPCIDIYAFPEIKDYQRGLIMKKEPAFIITHITEDSLIQKNYNLVMSLPKDMPNSFLYKRKD